VYRAFNATQSPFIVADFIIPTEACDINVSPDKRSILLHHEANLVAGLKVRYFHPFESYSVPFRYFYRILSYVEERRLTDAQKTDDVGDYFRRGEGNVRR
jgi:hypothetical protein